MSKKQRADLAPELDASEATELKHKVWAALDCIQDGTFTEAEALDTYELTKQQLEAHRDSWNSVQE